MSDKNGRDAAIKHLISLEKKCHILDMSLGEMYYDQGKVLNMLYHIEPGQRASSLLKRGEWGAFKSRYLPNISDDTIEDRRNVAWRCTREDVRQNGYSNCLAAARANLRGATSRRFSS